MHIYIVLLTFYLCLYIAQQNGSFGATWAGTIDGGYWVRPARVEPKRSEPHVPLAATFAAPAGMFN